LPLPLLHQQQSRGTFAPCIMRGRVFDQQGAVFHLTLGPKRGLGSGVDPHDGVEALAMTVGEKPIGNLHHVRPNQVRPKIGEHRRGLWGCCIGRTRNTLGSARR